MGTVLAGNERRGLATIGRAIAQRRHRYRFDCTTLCHEQLKGTSLVKPGQQKLCLKFTTKSAATTKNFILDNLSDKNLTIH
jgi:hypothetical protein